MRELFMGMERVLRSEETAVLVFNAQVEWMPTTTEQRSTVFFDLKLAVNSDVSIGNFLITLSTGSTQHNM